MAKNKSTYSGFRELLQARYPDFQLATEAEDTQQDLISDLRRARIDPAEYSGFRPHLIASPQNRHAIEHSRQVADELFATQVVEAWQPMGEERQLQVIDTIESLCPGLEIEFVDPCMIVISADSESYPSLPVNYAYKGGVARKALARALRLNANTAAVRDVDVFFRGTKRDPKSDEFVAKSFMQDDWLFARKPNRIIDLHETAKGYFRTREFTINQVFLEGDRITCSTQCLLDLVGAVIRPTAYHMRVNRGHVEGIVAAKAIRFFVEGNKEGRPMRLDPFTIRSRSIKHFHLALHFARALEKGDDVGLEYLTEVKRRGLSKFVHNGDIRDAIEKLSTLTKQPKSFFASS